MGYINKKLQNLIKSMDKTFSVGLGVRKWLRQSIYLKHNLILKSKDGYYCTNCKNKFHSTVKVGEYTICPKCKQELLVRMKTLQRQVFRDDFRILEFIDGYFVLRGFEVLSIYNNHQVSHQYQEYQRLVISKDKIYLLASDVLKNYMGYLSVSHNEKHTSWRLLDSQYRWYMSRGSIYWGELERDTDGTVYHYCPIQRVLLSYTGDTSIEILLQRILNNPTSFELLSKLELTNLAIDCDEFTNKGSFENRFGVTKDYLPFMVKYNSTYNELEVLQVIKHKNIRIVKKLSRLSNFKELSTYLNMEKALSNGLNETNEHLYKDYLDFAKRLHLNMKDRRVLYPVNIVESHNELLKQIEDIKQQEIIEKIKIRYEELKGNSYQDEKFAVFPASSMSSLILESQMQNNCVRTYGERYANHEVDLYFMRLLSNLEHSLVTIEVRGNEVVQCRIKNNASCTKEQMAFINKWERKVLMKEKLYGKV